MGDEELGDKLPRIMYLLIFKCLLVFLLWIKYTIKGGGEDCPSVPTNVLFFSLEGANFELKILAE